MRLTSLITITFIIILIPFKLCLSQNTKSFSQLPELYINELSDFFQSIDKKEDKSKCLQVFQDFKKEWESNKFSPKQQDKIYKTSNLMLNKKMKVYPHFYNYLLTLISLSNNQHFEKVFNPVHNSVNFVLNSSHKRSFIEYLEALNDVFTDNFLYYSQTTVWKSDKVFTDFIFDSIPRFIFKDITLTCYANKDSSCILNTSGIYYPLNNKWKGNEGKVSWKRAGFSEDSVFSKLNKYEITLKYYKYSADSAALYYKNWFSKPLLGRIEEKVRADVNEEKASYPRFDSYDKRIYVKNIFDLVDYKGGFSLYGSRLIGKGDKDNPANVIFKRKKQKFIVISSQAFIIKKDHIGTEKASATIYLNFFKNLNTKDSMNLNLQQMDSVNFNMRQKDSIYHPGLRMKYNKQNKELSLLRYEEGLALSPYFDTYHKIDMYFENLTWKMNESKIDLEMIKGPGVSSEAKFQSDNFFKLDKFYKIQGMDDINPLFELKSYYNKYKTKEFFLEEYARYIKMSLNQTKAFLLNLSNMGFLIYKLDEDKIIIKDRLFYYLNAKQGKTDYDVIEFNSLMSGKKSNATLNLENYDLTIRGIDIVQLSDSQKVYIFPENKEVVLKRNRDFAFNGRVRAGLFDFFGKQFSFEYDKFKLNLPTVDSLTFMVKSFQKDDKGRYRLVKAKSVIEGISGDLNINDPDNKAGLKRYPRFPILNSKKDSYVYYHRKFIQNGVYKKDKFYYKVDPFTIDSLDNFKTEHLAFTGILNSGGIFPDIEEPLKIQPDYSLGFINKTPQSGYPAYGGKANFLSPSLVNLSNKGLRGNGTLTYLTSTAKSEDFIFFPDSMNTRAQNYNIDEQISGVEYPDASGKDVYIHWLPYKDIMAVSSISQPISIFKNQTQLTGYLYLTPLQLTGKGMLGFPGAELESKLFKFKNTLIDADTADFRMKSYDLTEMSFITHNYKSHIDFIKRKGEFSSNGTGSKVEFPFNQYICFMDEFDWFMDKDELALADSKNKNVNLESLSQKELIDIDLKGSKFISIHPQQDSLQFFSPKAKYNLRTNIITAQGVKIIKVADAAIFPENEEITVFKKADMKTLEHASIIANTTTEYHNIYDATVNISARKKYTAEGKYDYIEENGNRQLIYFDKIGVDSTVQTFAKGSISISSNPELPDSAKFFHLSDAFYYTGDVSLLANREFLTFNGGVRIKQACDTLSAWLKFKAEINPKEIYIPISDKPADINHKSILAGMIFTPDSTGILSRFISTLPRKPILSSSRDNFDTPDTVLCSSGFLIYDKLYKEYRIADKAKLKTLSLPGNYLNFNVNKCYTTGEGKIKFGSDFGRVEFNAFGKVRHYIIPDSTTFDLAIITDFFFNEKSLDIISASLQKNQALKPIELPTDKFTKTLYEVMGVKEADKLISEISLGMGFKKVPEELRKTLVITDIRMKWIPAIRSYVSRGKIGIGNMYKEQIYRYVSGYIMLKKRKSGDELSIYLEPDNSEWYFFNYDCRKKLMTGVSSNKDFNNAISNTKPDNRKLKSKGDKETYNYYNATDRKKNEFLEKIQSIQY